MWSNQKGFTLIELMIVVVIIGILAAIALPNFIAMQERAKEASVKANMHAIQTGMEGYATISGGLYPVQANELTTLKPLMPGGHNPFNPYSNIETLLHWDQGINNTLVGQTVPTNILDSMGVAVAFTASGDIHISSGFSNEVSPASTGYAIVGVGGMSLIIDRGVLLNLHN